MSKIEGDVAPAYEPVADAFAAAFRGRPSMGAALSIRHEGRLVASLWSGIADPRTGKTWKRDTPSVIFSCTKGLISILAARLVRDGRLDYDAPVARYWPEFAQAGKDSVTVAQVLSHRSGLSAPSEDLYPEDILIWQRVTDALAAQAPLWRPGDGYAYHALTHGWLVGEIIRRITGVSVGTYFAEEIARPLGVDAWIGLPAGINGHVARLTVAEPLIELWANEAKLDSSAAPNWPYRAMTLGRALPAELVTPDGGFNAPRLQASEIPGAGGIATADALATIWSSLVTPTEGISLLDPATLDRATRPVSGGAPVFPAPPPYARWGMGFQLDSEARRYLEPRSFGHDGAGGQVTFADVEHRIGFAFLTNWMEGPGDERATAIIDALRAVLARQGERARGPA